ncbi:helix-turn-helix transcriptional regulator [Enterococcus avium]
MYHGEVVRKIRLSKGLTQKEVYLGIVSKSYAIEFEKGNHSISATLPARYFGATFLRYGRVSLY